MKHFCKQTAVLLAALTLTVCLIVGLSVNTLAAIAPERQQVGTNHCTEEEYDLTNPDGSPYTEPYTEEPTDEDDNGPTLELFCQLEITQPVEDAEVIGCSMEQKVPGISPNFNGYLDDLEPSDIPYHATLSICSCIFPSDPPVYVDHVAFYVREKGTVHFHSYAPGGALDVSGKNIELTEYIPYVKPTEEITTEPTEPTHEIIEVFTRLKIYFPDSLTTLSTTLTQDTDFTMLIDSLPVSDKPFYATADELSSIFPNEAPAFTHTVSFLHNKKGEITFRYDPLSHELNVSGRGVSGNAEPATSPDNTTTEPPEETTVDYSAPILERECTLTVTNEDYGEYTCYLAQADPRSAYFWQDLLLDVSDEPYYATLTVIDTIFPAGPPVCTDTVRFYLLNGDSNVTFSCNVLDDPVKLNVSGYEVEGVTHINTDPTYPTEASEETVTYPTSEPTIPPVWTTGPATEASSFEVFTSAQPTVEPTTEASTVPAGIEMMYGDANGDGIISIDDVTLIQLLAAEKIKLAADVNVDVNSDGKTDVTDATAVQRYIAELKTGVGNTGKTFIAYYTWPAPGADYISYSYGEYDQKSVGIAAMTDTPIVAAAKGTVIDVNTSCTHNFGKAESCGCGNGLGNYVMIDHGNGKTTLYAHLASADVKENEVVDKGQRIGMMGSTGASTGPHLHFETRFNSIPYDPDIEIHYK